MSLDQDLLAFNARLVRYFARVDGRDKLARTVAYGSDFVLSVLAHSGKEKHKILIHQISKVKAGCGVARKIFRIGAPTKDIDAIANIKERGPERMLRTVMHVCNGIYYSIDTVELLTIFDIVPYKTAEVKEFRYRFWVVKTAILLLLTLWKLRKLGLAIAQARQAEQDGDSKKKLDQLRWERGRALAQLMAVLTDIPIGFFQVTNFGRKHIGAGGAGLAGAIGSLINTREIWLQTAK